MDGQTGHEKTTPAEQWLDRSTSSPKREGKRGGDRLSPQKCGSTTDSAERDVFLFCFESFINNPLHAARRAMAAEGFSNVYPFPTPNQLARLY